MANSNAFSAVPDLYVEERVFKALVNGPLEQNERLLDDLEEVDVRMMKNRTLLHVGVSLGKVDWVEELLARGADPNLEDDCHSTAMSSAEEMLRRSPEDMNRRQVRRLVWMVNRRDQAMRRRLETPSARNAASPAPPVLQPELTSAMAAFSSSASVLKEEMRTLTAELRSLRSLLEELKRTECVNGMMERTDIVYGGRKGERTMRKLYKRLYDEDDATACLLTFLHRESRFEAKVDCDSRNIGRMKERVVDLDRDDQRGKEWGSYAEFSTNTVYFGAKVDESRLEETAAGVFARALALMSIHLCFKNGGKPYEGGDNEGKEEWERVFVEVEEEKEKRGGGLDWWIGRAWDWKTQAAKEFYLATCVPRIITSYGSEKGTRELQEQVPLLLRYFKEHVVATLLAKARE